METRLHFNCYGHVYECLYNDDEQCGILNLGNDTYYVIREILEMCGCMNDSVLETIVAEMDNFMSEKNNYEGENIQRLLIFHLLDNVGLLDHGSAIRGSWKTKKLEMIYPLIKANQTQTITQALLDKLCLEWDAVWNPIKQRTDLHRSKYTIEPFIKKICGE